MANRNLTTTGGNWSSTSTWVEGIVPTAADNVIASSTAGQLTIDTATAVCYDFDGSSYANTLTISSGQMLSVYTAIKLGASVTTAGTGTLQSQNFSYGIVLNINTNINCNFKFTGTGNTKALNTLNVYGLMTFSGSSYNASGTINAYGGFYMDNTNELYGAPAVNLYGGTWSTPNNRVSRFTSNTTYTFKGNVTLGSYICIGSGNRINYDSGTITTTGSEIILIGAADFTCGEVNWNNVRYDSYGGSTIRWYETPNIYGLLSFVGTQTNNLGGYTLNAYGGVTNSGTQIPYNATINIKGGTWTGILATTTNLAGNVTFGTTLGNNGTLTYVSGTITTTGSNFVISAGTNPTIDVNGNVAFDTITNSSTTFTIPEDITCNTYVASSGSTTNIADTKILTINTAITGNGTPASTTTIKETSGAGTGYINYLGTTANCNLKWISFTDITASGKPLVDFLGTLDTTSNIYSVDWTDISAPRVTTLEI